jgi:hypothetical protein
MHEGEERLEEGGWVRVDVVFVYGSERALDSNFQCISIRVSSNMIIMYHHHIVYCVKYG